MVLVRSLDTQEITDVSVPMCSPNQPGMYQGQWRMCTATGLYFGDVIWVILSVEAGGLLGVTQQLSSFETEFNTQPHRNVAGDFNPFASPQKSRSTEGESMSTWTSETETPEGEQNGLSQTSVNICSTDHQTSHSVATYREGVHGPYPFGDS
ncbi:hypothetical protein GDO81_006162 [Engystomops pustulosus]|uniref:Nbr1 FW domain-containing protein n=2 Tax=Engystomops pustulosus TaxID=76066 RepID=A0AAV7CUY1_ENGPU|nr:hypothetical protein GDO81_006162 [Engystomops pustulosus]KAG8588934.1 hypothetical protein GDO81_006162 [Engystomops pustulosus]